MNIGSNPGASRTHADSQIATTSGGVAMANLQAQIDGQLARASNDLCSVAEHGALIELVALRGHILGRIADYEWAEKCADALCDSHSDDGLAFVERARSRARFHRFQHALCDLDEACRHGVDPAVVDLERAEIFQALGEYDQALAHFEVRAERRADFASLGALATLHAECGDVTAAERFFEESRSCYRGVSPIPLALLDFQRGHMWMAQGDLHRARGWLCAACDLLPVYATAAGHLAEVDAQLGESEQAIERLRALAVFSDDPDYAASLARILADDHEAASDWRAKAAAGYEGLLARHPEAFSDHAAEFWLEAGYDPQRALGLARENLKVRRTPRAYELLRRATLATETASPA